MQSEIARILELVKSGALTAEQGAEMIAALRNEPAVDSADAQASTQRTDHRGERQRHRRGQRSHRHRSRTWTDDDFRRLFGAGARTLRWALGSGFGGDASQRGASGENDTILSRVQQPTGSDYRYERNHFAVAQLRGLRLQRSSFSDNDVDAAALEKIELVDSTFTSQRIRGSSVSQVMLEHGVMHDNELNGGRLARLAIDHGRLESCLINGSQLKDIGIANAQMSSCRFNGVTLKTVVVNADSHVQQLSLDGVTGRNWLLEAAVLSDVAMRGVRCDGLVMKNCGLEGVQFLLKDFALGLGRRSLALMRDTEFRHVVMKQCTFEDCVFDETRFEEFEAQNLHFVGVDFSGLVIASADALASHAEARKVA